jgi:hypothetical protein
VDERSSLGIRRHVPCCSILERLDNSLPSPLISSPLVLPLSAYTHSLPRSVLANDDGEGRVELDDLEVESVE